MALNKRVRKDGTVGWQVVVDDYDPATGKRVRHTIGTFSPKKRAQQEERRALDALEDGSFVLRSTDTVGDVLDIWLDSRRGFVRANTLVGYTGAIENYWRPRIGHLVAQKLTPMMVQSAINEWVAGGTYRTAEINLNVLSAAYRHGIALRLVANNPCVAVTVPRNPDRASRSVWTEEEVSRFLRHAEDDNLSLLWFLLIETGMRRGEALGLHWSSIDWSSSAVNVSHTAVQNKKKGEATMKVQPMGKTDASRRAILISEDLLERFRTWRKTNTSSLLVFPNGSGNPLTPTWVRKKLDDLAEAAGVPRLTIHELRHTAATRMMRARVPEVVAQQRMGHTSSDMLRQVYQHADAGAQRDAVEALTALSRAANVLSNAVGEDNILEQKGTGS